MERTVHQMGTMLRIRLVGVDRACGMAAAEAAIAEVARLEGVLSSWTDESELGRLNAAAPGSVVSVTPELAALLAEAGTWVGETGGAFDPAVGALVDAWDLRGRGRRPAPAQLAAARAASGWAAFERCGPMQFERGPAGWWLDSGAFGKGAALRAAVRVLGDLGVERAILDFGGQLAVLGSESVAVAHPARRDEEVARVRVRQGSVATTSASERFVDVDGTRLGHVLDPRSGRPVAAWGSVTVITSDAFVADALSTALFVMGADGALAWAAGRDDVAVLVLERVSDRLVARWNAAMQPLLSMTGAAEAGRGHETDKEVENAR
ncbi:MAG TPA: FAD:protein FMN transferase [Longimicrobiales bacterium]|nr:FAD:protein FMN transferase [Longimicrobiales bacterium]